MIGCSAACGVAGSLAVAHSPRGLHRNFALMSFSILMAVLFYIYKLVILPATKAIRALDTTEKQIESVKKSNDMMPELLENL